MAQDSASRTLLALVVVLIVVVAAAAVAGGYLLFSSGYLSAGNPETKTMDFSGFTAVDVGSAFKVTITQSDAYSVVVTANEKIFDQVEVTQTGSTLKIDVRPGTFTGAYDLQAQITMPELSSVVFSGATSGTAAGFRSTQPFSADLSGASSLGLSDFQAGNVTANVSGASRLTATGTANDVVSVISGASSLDFSGLTVNNAHLSLSGASHAQVDLNGRLDADLSGASSLQYGGTPTLGNITISGASSVSRR